MLKTPEPRLNRLKLLGIGAAVLVAGMAIGIFLMANIYNDWLDSRRGESLDTGASIPVGQKTAAQLIQVIEKNPNDTSALFEMGRRFYAAGFWRDAISILTRMLDADPANVDPNNFLARVGIGNSNFNLKNYAEAKKAWDEALKQKPNDAQLHFNLGVYYASIDPADKDAARLEWQKVIALVPGSDLAKASAQYIDKYATAPPTPTPTLPPGPAPTGGPLP